MAANTNNDNSIVQPLVKDYKWFNSQSLPLELQCGLVRLELSEKINLKLYNFENLTISSYIVCNQLAMHNPPTQTLFSQADYQHNNIVWDQLIHYPIKVRDLLLDSLIVYTLLTPEGAIVGGTTMRLFDDNGCLKQGRQKLLFYFDIPGDPNVIVRENRTPGEYYEVFNKYDQEFVMERHYERYRLTNCIENGRYDPKNEWLDRLLLKRMERFREPTYIDQYRAGNPDVMLKRLKDEYFGKPLEELELQGFCYLILDMPTMAYPVSFISFRINFYSICCFDAGLV